MRSTRAVSTALGYVLTLGITAVLVSGLLIAGGGFVEEQRERAIETELKVVGEQLATQLNAADRLNQSAEGDRNISIKQPLPSSTAGSSYSITLQERKQPLLRLETARSDIAVEVRVTNSTAMGQSTAPGGTVVVEYDDDIDKVVIKDA